MLELHALWVPTHGLILWAEDGHLFRRLRPGPLPEPDQPGGAPGHPYGATRGRLRSLVRELFGATTTKRLEPVVATVRLLGASGVPYPSPGTRYYGSQADGPPEIYNLDVEAYRVPSEVFVSVVYSLITDYHPLFPGGLRFLELVLAYTKELAARGRVIPSTIIDDEGRRHAVWLPLLDQEPERGQVGFLGSTAPTSLFVCAAIRSTRRRKTLGPALPRVRPDAVVAELIRLFTRQVVPAFLNDFVPPRHQTDAGAWLRALAGQGLIRTKEARPTSEFFDAVQAWSGKVIDPVGSQVTPVLRLTESRQEGEPWKVAAHPEGDLEAVPARDLAEWMRRLCEDAAALVPALGEFRGAGKLSPDEAFEVMDVGLLLLQAEGWRVEVPGWWLRRKLSLRAAVSPASEGGESHLGLEALVTVNWSVVLEGQELSKEELAEIAGNPAPLVRIGQTWVVLTENQRQAVVEFLDDPDPERDDDYRVSPLIDALRLGLGLSATPCALEIEGVAGEGWLESLLGVDGGPAREKAEPPGFRGELRHYQRAGLAWLSHLEAHGMGACLADDMGLGKTIQVLALLAGERSAKARTTLLVAPLSLVGNWRREAAKFAPDLKVYVHHGGGRAQGKDLAAVVRDHDLVLTTYGVVTKDQAALAAIGWHRVVLDEAQAVKNSRTRQARAVRALPATRRVALTGTPVENRLTELWSIMQVLNPGLLGTQADFQATFARPIERDHDEARAEALRRLVEPFVLRRKKSDPGLLPELPEKIESRRDCSLTREQAKLYRSATDQALESIEKAEGMARRGLVVALMTRLKQICNHPEHFRESGGKIAGRSGKLAALDEVLESLKDAGERALLFTQYRRMGDLLTAYLEPRFGEAPPFLHGGVSAAGREKMVDAFQAGEGPPLLLVSLKAGGTGLNLTAASHVIHFDRWWNPAVEDQATDRAYRIGQKRTVQVHKLVCVGTLEEHIDEMIESKRALAERVVGGGEAWVTELSTSELRDLLVLTEGATGG